MHVYSKPRLLHREGADYNYTYILLCLPVSAWCVKLHPLINRHSVIVSQSCCFVMVSTNYHQHVARAAITKSITKRNLSVNAVLKWIRIKSMIYKDLSPYILLCYKNLQEADKSWLWEQVFMFNYQRCILILALLELYPLKYSK